MLQSSSPVRRWKQWLLLPVGATLLTTMACEKAAEPATPTATAATESQIAPPPPPAAATESQPAPPPPPAVYTYVEQMPEYAGGMAKLLTDLTQQMQYPQSALAARVQGNVFVSFIVAEDGSVQAVTLKKGIGAPAGMEAAAKAMNEAALAAVRNLPGKWTPGKQDGKAVAVSYTVPITFALEQTQVRLPNQPAVSVTYPAQQR